MNCVVLMGRLVRDIEVKSIGDKGDRVVKFAMAVYRAGNKVDGVYKDGFFEVEAWNNNADFLEKHFKKGDGITVQGTLVQHSYNDKDGNTRYTTFVRGDKFGFPTSTRREESATTAVDDIDPFN